MKILNSLWSGSKRSVKVWKGVLIVWLVSLLLVSMVALPMKSALSAGLGSSTISEQLKNGINVEVFADLRANFKGLASYFSIGLMMMMLVSFVINSFLSGGLFNSLRKDNGKFSSQEFFRSSAKNFWSIIVISFIMSLLIIFLSICIIVVPVSLLSTAEKTTEVIIFNSAVLLSSLFLFGVIILLLTADYARAWQVSQNKNACFKAINYGFRQTFRTFFSSYPTMLIIIVLQFLYMWLVIKTLQGLKPQSETGIILLFLASQILFIMKIFLKTLRYGSITSMMESGIKIEAVTVISDSETDKGMMYEL